MIVDEGTGARCSEATSTAIEAGKGEMWQDINDDLQQIKKPG